ncbi:MAG: Fe-S cluster assembly sulfur transfer protein SufU [Betaproteobacteria bacterium]
MSKLYDEVILDHIRNARNYAVPDMPHRTGEAINPLCGDSFQVFVVLEGENIEQVGFQCECCGIAMASASIMTEWLRGRTRGEARSIKRAFLDALAAKTTQALPGAPDDHTAILQVVQSAPAREGCAALAWAAVEQAIAEP